MTTHSPAADVVTRRSILDAIHSRASVELAENFGGDLRQWTGHDGWSGSWSIDDAGFGRPGQLALYVKSISLTDYHVEFRGSVERKSLGFAYRALDFDNYYAARIVIINPGAIPEVVFERYAVINGQAGPRTRVRLPFPVRMDTLYHVQVEAKGDHFITRINDQLVDAFTDNRLPSGGVGFFSRSGESSRICWLRLTGQIDLVGNLCAWLAHFDY